MFLGLSQPVTEMSNLLTYSMLQSPSWEAKLFAASQEIPRILWNPNDISWGVKAPGAQG